MNPFLAGIVLFGAAVIAVTLVTFAGGGGGGPDGADPDDGGDWSIADRIDGGDGFDGRDPTDEKQVNVETVRSGDGRARWHGRGYDGIRGTVIDESGTPVPGARIAAARIRSLERTLHPSRYAPIREQSGADGTFSFDGIPLGTYSLVARLDDRAGRAEAVAASRRTAFRGTDIDCEIVLKAGGLLSGRVVDPDGGPVPKALVIPRKTEGALVAADASGHFTLAGLEAGVHGLLVVADGFAPAERNDLLTGDSAIEIALDRGYTARGRVLFEGNPRPGIEVRTIAHGVPFSRRTGKDGVFEIGPLPRGRSSLSVIPGEFCATSKSVRSGGELPVLDGIEIHLERTGVLAGSVTDRESGKALAGVWVEAEPDRSIRSYYTPRSILQTRTDGAGHFRFDSLPPCNYTIGVKRAGPFIPLYWKNGGPVAIEPGQRRDGIDFALEKGAAAEVILRGEDGSSIAGAEIRVRKRGRNYSSFTSRSRREIGPHVIETGDGRYLLGGLREGVHDVTASRRGWVRETEMLVIGRGDDEEVLEIALEATFAVSGKVVDPGGAAIAGAWVACRESGALSGVDGGFLIHDMTPQKQTSISARAPGFMRYRDWRIAIDREMDPLELTLAPEGTHFIAGSVRTDEDEPVVGIEISLYQSEAKNRIDKKAVTDDRGTFRFDGLLESEARLRAERGRGVQRNEPRRFPVDRDDTVVVLDRYACIRGRALDRAGQPLPVFAAGTTRSSRATRIASRDRLSSAADFVDGTFELTDVSPGEVSVGVLARDGQSGCAGPLTLAPGAVEENVIVTIAGGGAVAGRVVDGMAGAPVEGASIRVTKKRSGDFYRYGLPYGYSPDARNLTGPDGTFLVENVDPGEKVVCAVHGDYGESSKIEVTVVEGQVVDGLEITLTRGCMVEGIVTVDGKPEAGVRIYASRKESERSFYGFNRNSSYSGKDGVYQVCNLMPGDYGLHAHYSGENCSRDVEVAVAVGDGDVVTRDIDFPRGGTIEGTVRLVAEPLADVSVRVRPVDEEGVERPQTVTGRASSQKDGTFRIEGLTAGRFKLSAHHRKSSESWSFDREVDVGGGITVCDVAFGVGNNCEITGYVTENGIPVPGKTVHYNGDDARLRAEADENGFFRLSNLSEGKAHISASHSAGEGMAHFSVSHPVELAAGGSIRQDLAFRTGTGVLTGVVSTNGESTRYTYLRLRGEKGTDTEAVSVTIFSEEKEFRVGKLPAGRYTLTVYDPHRVRQQIHVSGSGVTRFDFRFRTGKANLTGTVAGPENVEGETRSAYLFTPGACSWKAGDTFVAPGYSDGVVAESGSIRKDGKFRLSRLAPERFDVVAVRVRDEKIVAVDVRQVLLVDGEKSEVALSVHGEE